MNEPTELQKEIMEKTSLFLKQRMAEIKEYIIMERIDECSVKEQIEWILKRYISKKFPYVIYPPRPTVEIYREGISILFYISKYTHLKQKVLLIAP